MPLNDGKSEINLPPRKSDRVAQIRSQRRQIDPDDVSPPKGPAPPGTYDKADKSGKRRLRDGQVSTVEISAREYDLLCQIAALSENFLPVLENAGMDVQQPIAFKLFKGALSTFSKMRHVSKTYADTHALLGMLKARQRLRS